ncbi:MAG: RNA polymerase sigma factor [Saprospiraceae bacterium]|jgi:RNA polymerase sigma-70 factor (ECF subfamily)|nr:RNA polymerase sigma factor [Saprospiraceae bacterium]
MKQPPLDELLSGCRSNDRRSQQALYDRFYAYGMAVALPYCSDAGEAREVLNEALLKVFTGIGRYDPSQPFTAWLRVIVVRTAINRYHHRMREPDWLELDEALLPPAELPSESLDQLSAEELLRLTQRLPPAYRLALNLYAVEGYSHIEIAEMLGISVGASKSNLSKARARLRQLMDLLKLLL